jgi:hypothetical protein
MRHMVLFNAQYRVLLIASLISSCLLLGCESNFDLERFYRPTATREVAPAVTLQPRTTPPQLLHSHNPDMDGRLLWQHGYVLIGTTSFDGAPDSSYAARVVVAQGQKVGAAIVLLKARSYSTSCCWLDESLQVTSEGDSYFASYWAKSDPANTSRSN